MSGSGNIVISFEWINVTGLPERLILGKRMCYIIKLHLPGYFVARIV